MSACETPCSLQFKSKADQKRLICLGHGARGRAGPAHTSTSRCLCFTPLGTSHHLLPGGHVPVTQPVGGTGEEVPAGLLLLARSEGGRCWELFLEEPSRHSKHQEVPRGTPSLPQTLLLLADSTDFCHWVPEREHQEVTSERGHSLASTVTSPSGWYSWLPQTAGRSRTRPLLGFYPPRWPFPL